MAIEKLSKDIFNDYEHILNIESSSFKMKTAETASGMWFVSYEQIKNDVPIYNSELGYTINKNGNLVSLGGNYYKDVDVSTTPSISSATAIALAKKSFEITECTEKEETELVILPKETNDSMEFYLTWKIFLASQKPHKQEIIFVNAENGQIIESINNFREESISGTVSGGYWPEHYYDNSSNTNLFTTEITLHNYNKVFIGQLNTNSSGYYIFDDLSPYNYIISISLQNNYIRLRGYDNAIINETETITTGTHNVDWGTTDATNVRWHANVIHDYFVNTFGYYTMNYQMEGYVDQGYFVNGGADGTDIYFGSASGQYWARSSDVVYHEYTHNVVNHIYGGWIGSTKYSQGAAMDEGFSDYFACTKNNDDIQGESVGVNRDLSNSYSWVSTLGPWRNGQVIGGACWDVRSEVGTTIGDQLTFKSLQVTPHADNFQDFLYNMLIVNENNYSGAYTDEIIDAFDNHNITVPIPSAPQNLSVTESANEYALLSWDANTEPDLKEYNIYRKGGYPFVDWTMVATSTTNSYEDLEVTTSYSHGDDFFYKVTAVDDYNLESNYSNTVEIEARLEKQMIDEEIVEEAPKVYVLNSNYPNPFNPTTQISYQIPNDGFVNLTIYNSLGQAIVELVNEYQPIGRYTVQFNANNLSSGIYFYRIVAGEFNSVKKMLLVK